VYRQSKILRAGLPPTELLLIGIDHKCLQAEYKLRQNILDDEHIHVTWLENISPRLKYQLS
jgi:hypothetical protein